MSGQKCRPERILCQPFDKLEVLVGACRKLLYAEELALTAENALVVTLTKNVVKHLGNAIVVAL